MRGSQWEAVHLAAGSPTPLDVNSLDTLAQQVGYIAGQANWLERVENYSPWNDVFSCEQQETELVIDVPFENRYLFMIYAIGYNRVVDDNLKRINPIAHPYWNWMRCSRIAYKGVRFIGHRASLGNSIRTADYTLARFSLGFANYPWSFYEDSQINSSIGEEIYRNTYYEFQPTTQFLTAEGGANVLVKPYVSNAFAPGSLSATGTTFKAPFGTPCSQILYKLHWKWVPFDYIFKDFIPVNLYECMEKVNFDPFIVGDSMPQGTVRFGQPEIRTYCSPIRTTQFPEILCDITINLTYFNPLRKFIGPSETKTDPGQLQVSGTAPAVRGHNLVPRREDGLWEPATRLRLSTLGIPLPPEEPTIYNQLFKYANLFSAFIKPT